MDEERLVACFTGTHEELDAIGSLARFGAAALRFRRKFIQAYGHDRWRDFQNPDRAPRDGDATLVVPMESHLAALAQVEIRISQGLAQFTLPGEPRQRAILQVKNRWFVQASSFLPAGAEPGAFADMMVELAAVLHKYERAIGASGITSEDIDAELGRAIAQVTTGATSPAKHRFNIDRIHATSSGRPSGASATETDR
jgi:hypothetical protein